MAYGPGEVINNRYRILDKLGAGAHGVVYRARDLETRAEVALKFLGDGKAFDPKNLQPIYEAQVARDETMAARLAEYLQSPAGQGRIALAVCGRGHCEFGLGTPARVARRIPQVTQRIVLMSESGDLHLTAEERKQARDIEITHGFLREVGRPPADYFHIAAPAALGGGTGG